MIPFQNTVAECELYDMKTSGAFFTCTNKQPSDSVVFSRIDRVLINTEWLNVWPDYYAHFAPEGEFDHCPCVITYLGDVVSTRRKPFKFFNMWSKVPDFQDIVQKGWSTYIHGSPMYRIVQKLKLLKPDLKKLNRNLFADVERNADISYAALLDCQKNLQADPRNTVLMDIEYQSRESYLMLAKARDAYLRQKAKCNWAKEGDTNSAMFHKIIKHRQIQNKVLRIEDDLGRICTKPDDILNAFVQYYEHLLGSSTSTTGFYPHIVTKGEKVSINDWENLCQIPSNDEIKQVVFSIPDD
ncbi:uncharacterized protein LOC141619980 [Silene latifolia]|uniref:uncharacterized protein LOC141619980 n=1 Tax=Silene latifolia TaxID=37657 RepID=UPI003D78021C